MKRSALKKRNKYIGNIREKRVRSYISSCLKWNIEKANYAFDKFHAIDFICKDKKNELIFVQVKGTSQIHKPFAKAAIDIACKHNARLYYFYVSNKYESKIYLRKYDPGNEKAD